MRVLHLIDGGFRASGPGVDPEGDMLACRSLVARAGHQQTVCVLGPRSAARCAEGLGLRVDAAIAPRLGLPEAGWLPLRRVVSAWGRPDVAQCWGPRAARLALRALGEGVPRVAVLPQGDAAAADIGIVCSEAARERLAGNGIGRVVVLPAPAWERAPMERDLIRFEMGAEPGDLVLALLGGPPQADAMRLMFMVSMLRAADIPVRGVIAPQAAHRMRARAFGRGTHGRWLCDVRRPMSVLLGACDLAVFDGGGPGPTRDWDPAPWAGPPAIAAALAAGVPVVAPAWALEGPCRTGLYATHNSTLPELVRGLMELAQDPERRERMGREAREQCGAGRCGDGFVRGMNEVWEDATAGEAALG